MSKNQSTTTNRATSTTGIEWTDHTWNPFVGCSVHSDGCKNCYAMNQGFRLEHSFGMPQYQGTTKLVNGKRVWTGQIRRSSQKKMNEPYRYRDPALVFVNSMSDFFHPNAADIWRTEALTVMQNNPRHQFQILTKRPEEIAKFAHRTGLDKIPGEAAWFPPNVWIGATVENAKAVHRIATIQAVQTAVKFLSIEPLIGPVGTIDLTGIDWVIVGGESGPGARPCNADWVREVRNQSEEQGIPLFFKQWGKPANNPLFRNPPHGYTGATWLATHDSVGKGGSMLDGAEHKEFPHTAFWSPEQ